jgi:hypothetical protein
MAAASASAINTAPPIAAARLFNVQVKFSKDRSLSVV